MKFTPEGKAAVETILRCMQEADAAFQSLSADENKACFDFHNEGSSLNHCTRWGLQAAEEVHAEVTEQDVPKPPNVIRYVVTHINKDDMRTMCGPAQGRCTHATAEEAQELLDAMMKNNPMKDELLAGVYGLPLEVRPVKCYPGHFDPIGVYFDTEGYAERMIQQEADRQVG